VIAKCIDGATLRLPGTSAWQRLGKSWSLITRATRGPAHFYHLPIDQFVLDFANREMADIDS